MEWAYQTASDLIRNLKNGQVTSKQLVEYYFMRIDRLNPDINAVIQQQREAALQQAELADLERQAGKIRGPLHGLPLTIKESFNVKGLPTTSGAKHLRSNIAPDNAPTVQSLLNAGAIITGKTNVPTMTSDWQTYNDIYGTTNNPWDLNLSPGGSSGGSAAALAAGLTPVEFGSDLIGCLRIPAHYTGVFAHRCSLGIMSVRGHVPGSPPDDPSEPDLSAAGPLARCAADLRLMMKVLYKPWLEVPVEPDFSSNTLMNKNKIKVLTWFGDTAHEVDASIKRRYEDFVSELSQKPEIEVHDQLPEDIRLDELFELAIQLSARLVGTSFNARQRMVASLASLGLRMSKAFTSAFPEGLDRYYAAMNDGSAEHRRTDQLRQEYHRKFEALFQEYDVLLMPVSPVLAIPHMQQAVHRRSLNVNGRAVGYNEHLIWNVLATVLGLPSTVMPLQYQDGELPCGIQVVSGQFQDDKTIDFAELCEEITGGFVPPIAYRAATV
ncbi:amidase [Paenibacillus donghaensis]|uniref:amidase family protein n=1 Tax=Paenibacillus donghaensis TaxID=414771 RepID=UPI0018842A86|nr:amidase family protein [Paenibacillus donghaensis]MBE9913484.1 amidase [Paenibacillus donghaensis]